MSKKIPWNKGLRGHYSKEYLKKLSDSHKGKPNPHKGVAKTSESKDKISRHFSDSRWINKDGVNKRVPSSEYDKYIQEGWNPGSLQKSGYNLSKSGIEANRRAQIKRWRNPTESQINNCKRNFVSKPEKHIIQYLSNYFQCNSQYFISGSSHPYDMLVILPNSIKLLIEYDGAYWHKETDYSNDPRESLAKLNGFEFLIIHEEKYIELGLKYVKSEVSKYFPDLINYSLSNSVTT